MQTAYMMSGQARDSVAGGFAEVAAVVVAAEEFVGFGVDGDEFAVAPDAGVSVVGCAGCGWWS